MSASYVLTVLTYVCMTFLLIYTNQGGLPQALGKPASNHRLT